MFTWLGLTLDIDEALTAAGVLFSALADAVRLAIANGTVSQSA